MIEKKLTEFDKNVFDTFNKTWAILTCGDKQVGFNGMTISWGGLGILWNKPVAYVFVRHSRYTYEFIEKSESVSLSFLSDEYKNAKVVFGRTSGRDTDKFKETNLTAIYDDAFNGYYIGESDFVFEMKKLYSVDIPFENLADDIKKKSYPTGDMHRMYVCEITKLLTNEE